ncbi:MAG: hypothetical protein AB7U98_09280, partial [Candidatus Nitrosocosmicus sp.]
MIKTGERDFQLTPVKFPMESLYQDQTALKQQSNRPQTAIKPPSNSNQTALKQQSNRPQTAIKPPSNSNQTALKQ